MPEGPKIYLPKPLIAKGARQFFVVSGMIRRAEEGCERANMLVLGIESSCDETGVAICGY